MKKLSLILICLFLLNKAEAQDQLILKSENLDKLDTVWVFTPANYNEKSLNEYPLVFLLHGWSGNYKQWNNIIDCQSYADKYEFIIVCPDGLYNSWYINSPAIKGSQYMSFFFNDLIPEMLHKYNTDKNNVFITGLSMGGHGALYLFSQNPELFKSAGSISGVLNLSHSSDEFGINTHLGLDKDKRDSEILMNYSVIGNIDKIANAEKEIIFSCGTDDRFYLTNNEFHKKCDELKIRATYISDPGGHNYDYWGNAIKYHFLFFNHMVH